MGKYSSDSDSSLSRSKTRRRRRSSSSSSEDRGRSTRDSSRHKSSSSSRHRRKSPSPERPRRGRRSPSRSRKSRSTSRHRRRRSRSSSYNREKSRSHHSHRRRSSSRDRKRSTSRGRDSKRPSSRYKPSTSKSSRRRSSSSSSDSSEPSKLVSVKREEDLREKLIQTIKAAEAADQLLREKGALPSHVRSRNDLDLLAPPIKPDPDAVREIEDDFFAPKSFTSSKTKGTDLAVKKEASSISKPMEKTVFHDSFFSDPQAKMDKWVKKLYQFRQRALKEAAESMSWDGPS